MAETQVQNVNKQQAQKSEVAKSEQELVLPAAPKLTKKAEPQRAEEIHSEYSLDSLVGSVTGAVEEVQDTLLGAAIGAASYFGGGVAGLTAYLTSNAEVKQEIKGLIGELDIKKKQLAEEGIELRSANEDFLNLASEYEKGGELEELKESFAAFREELSSLEAKERKTPELMTRADKVNLERSRVTAETFKDMLASLKLSMEANEERVVAVNDGKTPQITVGQIKQCHLDINGKMVCELKEASKKLLILAKQAKESPLDKKTQDEINDKTCEIYEDFAEHTHELQDQAHTQTIEILGPEHAQRLAPQLGKIRQKLIVARTRLNIVSQQRLKKFRENIADLVKDSPVELDKKHVELEQLAQRRKVRVETEIHNSSESFYNLEKNVAKKEEVDVKQELTPFFQEVQEFNPLFDRKILDMPFTHEELVRAELDEHQEAREQLARKGSGYVASDLEGRVSVSKRLDALLNSDEDTSL